MILNCHKTTVQQDQQNLLNRARMLQREAKRQKQDADKSKQLARKVEQLKEKVLDCKQQFKSQNNMQQIPNSWKNRAKLNYRSSSEFWSSGEVQCSHGVGLQNFIRRQWDHFVKFVRYDVGDGSKVRSCGRGGILWRRYFQICIS